MRQSLCSIAFLLSLVVAGTLARAEGDPNAPLNESAYPAGAKIKIACVGDSITYGYGNTAPRGQSNAPPAQLQRMLGDHYDVRNFGVNSTTLLNKGDKPYQKETAFARAKEFKPDAVIIMLGSNDTKAPNWPHKDEFAADLKDMVGQFTTLETKPRIWVVHPCYVVADGTWGINEPDILEEIPMIDGVAKELSLGTIDVHGATKGHDALFNKDKVHPNNDGAAVIAATYYKALTGKDYAGLSSIIATAATTKPAATAQAATASQPAQQ